MFADIKHRMYKIRAVNFIIKRDFNDVVEENTDFVAAIVRKFVKDPETVKDLTQEIFLRAYTNYERYTEDGKIRAWLAVIANNMLKNHYKAEQYQTSHLVLSPVEYISAELLPPENMPEDIVIQRDILDRITKIINSLPEKQRDVIIYSYFYDYSEKEIAAIQDMTLSAVKSAKYFGLEKVRKLMGPDYYGGAANKYNYNINRKLGRYKMLKSYAYNNSGLSENTELKKDSIIEGISPTKKEISDISRLLNISEDTVKALTIGDIDKVKKDTWWASAKFNDKLNVMIEPDNLLICHDGKPGEYDGLMRDISKIWALVNVPGYINLDFMDICKVMNGATAASIGSGRGKGESKAGSVYKAFEASPLLANNINKSQGVIVSVTASTDIKLDDIDDCLRKLHNNAHPDAMIIIGVSFDEELHDEIVATIMCADKPVEKGQDKPALTNQGFLDYLKERKNT